MKKIIILLVISFCSLLILTSCKGGGGVDTPPVTEPVYDLVLSQNEINLYVNQVKDYDFSNLFTPKKNGVSTSLSDATITNSVKETVGSYSYTVTYQGITKTLIVNVIAKIDVVLVKANVPLQQVKKDQFDSFDLTKLFTITVNEEEQTVLDSYLTVDKQSEENYIVTCKYQNEMDMCFIQLVDEVYELSLIQDTVHLQVSEVDDFDINDFVTFTIEGEKYPVVPSMVITDVTSLEGTYSCQVKYRNTTLNLKIIVEPDHSLELIAPDDNIYIEYSKVDQFNFCNLFVLYEDSKVLQITESMLSYDISNITVGNTYQIRFKYANEYLSVEKVVNVVVIDDKEITITSNDVTTYQTAPSIDLTTLFTIIDDGKNVRPTMSMISGSVDYSTSGTYNIVLTYKGITKTATITVQTGVVFVHKYENKTIPLGTNQITYDFSADFSLVINGITFLDIDKSYFNFGELDFNKIGSYDVSVKIPYNEKKFGLSGVKFDYYEASITYIVVENDYSISVNNELVELPVSTTSYKPFSNIVVTVNGKRKTITDNIDYVDIVSVYAKVVSSPIKFDIYSLQDVIIDVYVNGPDQTPVRVSYQVVIKSKIDITSSKAYSFSGNSLYLPSLFKIVEEGKDVPVTTSMISGYIDLYTPGIYPVTLTYKGVTKTIDLFVLDSVILGTYKTKLVPIPIQDDIEEDYTEGSDTSEYQPTYQESSKALADLVINADGTITFSNVACEIVEAISPTEIIAESYSYRYLIKYENGIITIDPDNSIKLAYHEAKRPLVYFDTNKYELMDRMVINYSSAYVLNLTYASYSFDVIKYKDLATSEIKWYAIKTHLIEKTGSDTLYQLTFGTPSFSEGFDPSVNGRYVLTLDGKSYDFIIDSRNKGKIFQKEETKKYQSLEFTGVIDGQNARVIFDQYENISIYINNKRTFSMISMHINSLVNGGVDYENNEVFVYSFNDQDNGVQSYKLELNLSSKTFTVAKKDQFFGLYQCENMLIFLDGYGTGHISFDTKSYVTDTFTYTFNNNIFTLNYTNTKPTFTHGTYSLIATNVFLNTLIVTDMIPSDLNGKVFVNKNITDGAIVNFKSYQIGQDSDTVSKKQLFDNISIITASGELDDTALQSCVDTSKIRFNTPGFYQLSISLPVNNTTVTALYTIEILEAKYAESPLVGYYSGGVMYKDYGLTINKYGQVILSVNGKDYIGKMNVIDNTFTSYVKNGDDTLLVNGELITRGLVSVRVSGSAMFTDLFTTGLYKEVGTKDLFIREFSNNGVMTYYVSSSSTSFGSKCLVNFIEKSNLENGAIISFAYLSRNYVVKVNDITSKTNGLYISDAYRGTFSMGDKSLVLDGFASGTFNGVSGTYEVTNGLIVFTSSNGLYYAFEVNLGDSTFTVKDLVLDNSLVNGKSYSATYSFICNEEMYSCTTTFVFGENTVEIKSTSESHDDDALGCLIDTYSPLFITKNATYSISGNVITIKTLNNTFTFKIDNVINASSITCLSSDLDLTEQGAFSKNTQFVNKTK